MRKIHKIITTVVVGVGVTTGVYLNQPIGFANPDVTQNTMNENICNPSWTTKNIRPPVSYTNKIKVQLMASKHLSGQLSDYELDHIIALTNGGHPTDLKNLQMQAYEPRPGAHEKDQVEVYIHKKLCKGELTLKEAQKMQANDWLKVYNENIKNHFGGSLEFDQDDD